MHRVREDLLEAAIALGQPLRRFEASWTTYFLIYRLDFLLACVPDCSLNQPKNALDQLLRHFRHLLDNLLFHFRLGVSAWPRPCLHFKGTQKNA